MIGLSTSIAVVVAAMVLLVVVRGLGEGELTPPRCPICGAGSSGKHHESCPWCAREDNER